MDTGTFGEQAACDYLAAHGYTVLLRNFHSRYGEIDIVAQDAEYLAFVEVKTRGLRAISTPQEAVSAVKQHKLIQTAQVWMMKHPPQLQPRFDVIAITVDAKQQRVLKLEHIKNAFDATGAW